MIRRLLVTVLVLLPTGTGAESLARRDLRATSIEGCAGIARPERARSLRIAGSRAIDVHARYWEIDRPAAFAAGVALVRYRVGDGVLRVESRLAPDLSQETVSLRVERAIDPAHLAVYLPGVSLPCERRTRYAVETGASEDGDLERLAEFDRRLHEAEELLYDRDYAQAEARLGRAQELRPDDPAPYWMMSRLRYLRLEASARDLPSAALVSGYEDAERWADGAVARAPERAEGYLWQGIARGRIATSLGKVRLAFHGALGGRGPSWLEQTLRKAVALDEDFRFFGFSTRADALYALAQFYRLAPDGWYMRFVGTRGDLDRSIELLEQAVKLQPVRIEYRKELAVALLCRGRAEDLRDARAQLETLLGLPAITEIDRIDRSHARAMLAGGDANVCWYSRDSFGKAGT